MGTGREGLCLCVALSWNQNLKELRLCLWSIKTGWHYASSGPLCFSSVSISSRLLILLLFLLRVCVCLFVCLFGTLVGRWWGFILSLHLTGWRWSCFLFYLFSLNLRLRKEDKREDSRKMFCYHYPPANLHPSIASRLQSALDLPGSFGVGPPSLTCELYLFSNLLRAW